MLVPLVRIALKGLPDSAAFLLTRSLAARTSRSEVTSSESAALARATALPYGDGNLAWSWGEGPPVVLVHGWNGRAAQMAPLAAHVADQGFRAVALDVTGHGHSRGSRTEWRCFLRDVAAVAQALGQRTYAFVGHSAGALTLMAARHAGHVTADRFVLICAPTHPFPAINMIRRKLAPAAGVISRYREHVARQFSMPWETLSQGRVYEGDGNHTLLFYDTTDRIVDHSEGDRIAALAPGARLVKTDRYSHAAILTATELFEEVTAFLRPGYVR